MHGLEPHIQEFVFITFRHRRNPYSTINQSDRLTPKLVYAESPR